MGHQYPHLLLIMPLAVPKSKSESLDIDNRWSQRIPGSLFLLLPVFIVPKKSAGHGFRIR
jgi:hypothetical protein